MGKVEARLPKNPERDRTGDPQLIAFGQEDLTDICGGRAALHKLGGMFLNEQRED